MTSQPGETERRSKPGCGRQGSREGSEASACEENLGGESVACEETLRFPSAESFRRAGCEE